MRGLVSSTCLLFHIIAILAVFSSVSGEQPWCHELEENEDVLDQMKNCQGSIFMFNSTANPGFDLSKLDQATADKILYNTYTDGRTTTIEPKYIVGDVTIIDSALEHLSLVVGNFDVQQKVEIVGNMKLGNLKLRPYDRTTLSLTLTGNKNLSIQSIRNIEKLHSTEKRRIQEYRECSFNGKALESLIDLEGCKRIYGDLIIDQSTKIPDRAPTLQIEKFEKGCVKIENSALKDPTFLDDLFKNQMTCTTGKHVIKNNKDLCLSSEQREKWIAAGFELVYTGTCDDRCTVDYAIKNKDAAKAACDVVVGDVKITGDHRCRRQSGTPPQLAHWDRVKKLEGTLEVSGTNLENITIFNNLEKISNPSPEKIALTVIRNSKMAKFDLPKLKHITMPSNTWSEPIFFQDNGNFSFSYIEGKRWERSTGRSHLMIPVDPPIAPGTTKQKQISDKNKAIRERNAEIKKNEELMILGASVVGCIIAMTYSVVWIWIMYRRKSKKRAENREKLSIPMASSEQKEETLEKE